MSASPGGSHKTSENKSKDQNCLLGWVFWGWDIVQAASVIQNNHCLINAALGCFLPAGRNAVINASIFLFSLAKMPFKH